MPFPFLLPLLGLALSAGSSIYSAHKQNKYNKAQEAAQEEQRRQNDLAARRAALARTIGFKSNIYRDYDVPMPKAPNMTGSAILGGIGNILGNLDYNQMGSYLRKPNNFSGMGGGSGSSPYEY